MFTFLSPSTLTDANSSYEVAMDRGTPLGRV